MPVDTAVSPPGPRRRTDAAAHGHKLAARVEIHLAPDVVAAPRSGKERGGQLRSARSDALHCPVRATHLCVAVKTCMVFSSVVLAP